MGKYTLGFFWKPNKTFNSPHIFPIRKSHDDKYGSNGEGDSFEADWNRAMAKFSRLVFLLTVYGWETVNMVRLCSFVGVFVKDGGNWEWIMTKKMV